MASVPVLPIGIRALNRTLRLLGGLTPYGQLLSSDRLHRLASKQTGLMDFGSPSYRVGFDKLLGSLNEEARLTPLGRLIATEEVLTALKNRLQLEAHHQQYPDIGAAPIRRPIIMIGMGRSGTTILHELLALDPANRIPATWEVDMPFPAPEKSTYDTDPRIDIIQKRLDRTDSIIPDFKSIHRMGARLPQECVRITTGEFASMIFGCTYEVPSYSNWLLEEADAAPAYDYHRRFLQLLQWKCPAERWVLKSPGHLWTLPQMLAAYPDARLIQTHRDPLKTASSLSSLITTLRAMGSDDVDPPAIAKQWIRWNTAGVNASARARQEGLFTPDQIIDVSFYEFMDAPLDQMERIYDFFELELLPSVRTRMQDYLSVHTAEQHGVHHYDFHDFGLDLAEERERVRPYQEYFDVPAEI
ncbi:MAG: sulfotransferase [Deltaproteobacteria bacterium]|nr:sulfotransferase [Deltaproteobacteria bacterium]